jgi:hypothetical protein
MEIHCWTASGLSDKKGGGVKNFLEYNESTIYQHLWGTAKAVLRDMSTYIRRKTETLNK